jgi:MFS family permease
VFLDQDQGSPGGRMTAPAAGGRENEGRAPGLSGEEAACLPGKWRILALLALVELLANSVWFSASAVVPQLAAEWRLGGSGQSWLTMSVQLGFVAGTFLAALLNLADRVPLPLFIGASCLSAAGLTAGIGLFAGGAAAAFVLRFLTGAVMAGVYPPGMKLVATWCGRDRGLGMGILVGALTVGSAVPHLLAALPAGLGNVAGAAWRPVLVGAGGMTLAAAVVAGAFLRPGPLLAPPARFDARYALRIWARPGLRLANFGYLGHMWELYAMWAWAPLLILASYERAGRSVRSAHWAGFGAVAVGALGCVAAGLVADRWGRTRTTAVSLAVSGACCLGVGFAAGSPGLLTAVCLVWGAAVVADSAQYSAAVSELSEPAYMGTALTIQTCLGFLLTMVTIRLVPVLTGRFGWGPALAALSLGPLFGLVAMLRLRRRPEAVRLAGGKG